jgi:hypothetical protein
MTDRIQFIAHQGKQILLADLSNSSAVEVEETCRALPDVVTILPRCSVLELTDFTGASIDREAFQAMKGEAVFDKAYVKKTAWVGAANFPQEYSNSLTNFSGREFPLLRPAMKPWHGWRKTESAGP